MSTTFDTTRATSFDAERTEGAGFADTIRNLRTALFLGWRVEANWTDPLLFVIYTVVKPIASLLLLVMMIQIAQRMNAAKLIAPMASLVVATE